VIARRVGGVVGLEVALEDVVLVLGVDRGPLLGDQLLLAAEAGIALEREQSVRRHRRDRFRPPPLLAACGKRRLEHLSKRT
jgi:hypothetical protein